jgi:integrase
LAQATGQYGQTTEGYRGVQELLGHQTIGITMDIQNDVINRLNERLKNKGKKRARPRKE